MAAKQPVPKPRHCIQHSRFTKQDCWRLDDLSLSLNGNIAVTGGNVNTYRTYVDVYTNVRHSDSRDKPKLIYSKEFKEYVSKGERHRGQLVSFYPGSDTTILSGLGDKLEVIDLIQDRVMKSRKIKLVKYGNMFGEIYCLSVRETEIFIGFWKSNKITVYDVIDLNEIKSIISRGIQDGYFPYDMTAITDKVFVCVGEGKEESNDKSLIFEEINGRILSDLTKPTDTVQWYVQGLALNIMLNVIAVVWSQTYEGESKGIDVIVFYSLLSENNCSFLIVEVEFGVHRIRISDRGDRMITGTRLMTGEVKVYDMADLFTYHHLRENLISQLQRDECVRLINYFALPPNQADAILRSRTPKGSLLHALEERGVIQPSSVDRLMEAFHELNFTSCCFWLLDFYRQTRRASSYDRFLATLSAHLTASLPEDLCGYFKVSDEKKSTITLSENPGLALLMALDEMGIIKSSKVEALEHPLTEFKLVQAVAKIHEYQSVVEEEKSQLLEGVELAMEVKKRIFIQCLQKKIKSWYETMTPVPWKKSCRWKSAELFVGIGLVLTESKAKRSLMDIDEKCKLQYTEIFSHESLKAETRIILEGDPGSGKTMLASQLAYDWSLGKISEVNILIFLPLKFVERKSLVKSLREFYIPENKGLSNSDIEDFLTDEGSKCCFILDGLEEYNGGGGSSEVMQVMTKTKYPSCKVILTSRPEYAQNLPPCPMLKLGRFGEDERNAYIEKVFLENREKQFEVKKVIEDNPFILDLCNIPVLFVLAVHNIESMEGMKEGSLNRVSPFMASMVDTLCSSVFSKVTAVKSNYQKHENISLEQIAFNGLCKGYQQLSWPKKDIEASMSNSKQWLDSGILVVDDANVALDVEKNEHQILSSGKGEASNIQALQRDEPTTLSELVEHLISNSPSTAKKSGDFRRHMNLWGTSSKLFQSRRITGAPLPSSSDQQSPPYLASKVRDKKAEKVRFKAKHVTLQVKFLHKLMQEWFAAKHFTSEYAKLKSPNVRKKWLKKKLPFINPTDLHYVLRFACNLYAPCTHPIMKHLLTSYHSEEGSIPEHIMNCAFLCFAEFEGDPGPDVLEAVMMVCNENIIINSDDSRLLQQAKVSMLKLASDSGILIKKIVLADLLISATKDFLTFNSGVTMEVMDTLRVIDISRWDQILKEEDYPDIFKYIAKCSLLERVNLYLPARPPDLDKETLIELESDHKRVTWMIGPRVCQTLDTITGEWQLGSGKQQLSATLSDSDDNRNEKQMQQPLTSCLPGTSADSDPEFSRSQGTQKQSKRNSIPEAGLTEKLAKDFREGTPYGGVSKSQLAGCYNVQKTITTKVGGTLEIFNTGIALVIPPNALPADKKSHEIQMRCVPRRSLADPEKCFSSNSSAVVEILPDLMLQDLVRLSLPHCLVLQQNVERKAKIFVSHHDKETQPFWEEQKEVSYHVEDTNCIMLLNSFSWYTYSVDDDIVTAKKLIVYAAAQKLEPHDEAAKIEVGCYPDLPGDDKVIQGRPNLLVAHKKILYFVKREEPCPLRISLNAIFPNGWRCQCNCEFPDTHSQEISYCKISANLRSSCVYILQKEENVPGRPLCVFTASQEGNTAVQLAVNFQVLDKNTSTAEITGNQIESSLKAESSITKSGGELQIKGTGVVLKIPPNALKGNAKKQFVHMRIISNRIIEDQGTSLSSNSCTAVEIFPYNISLRKPAELRLPHCLMLNETSERGVRIFTNHGKGSPASWNEDKNIQQALDDNACVIKLTKLCGVKYFIDNKIVRGKKIRVYTAAKEVEQKNEVAEIEIGYYPCIPGSGELLRMNPSFTVDSEETLPFMEEQKTPLQLNLIDISPPQWARWFPKDKSRDIPFEVIASSIEHSHLFILQKTNKGVGSAFCRFTALQKGDERATTLAQTLRPKEEKPKDAEQSEGQVKTADTMTVTIKYLSSKMGDLWKSVGRNLGLEDAVLDIIEIDYRRTQEQSYQMLRQWKQRNGTDASHTKLIQALIEAGRKDLAEDVQNRKDQEDA